MHLITTHANADFDAIASLIAAHRLYPDAFPLLPNTLNRNVRDFITLHENQFPFVQNHELGRQVVNRLTLVDTHHLPRLKQLTPNPLLHIIDHHELHETPPGAIVSLTDTGANVTLLVEQIRAQKIRLSSLESTLFLLGIYEDTGSLTYANTTPRDLYAAGWLLADGRGQLDLVHEYLNYAMSPAQIALYDQLVGALETVLIQRQAIMIGTAAVDHHVPEISNVAHRLRDLYSPAALFILVKMHDHIQLVARSTTDEIDVGEVAGQLGGGGHPRAAAASTRHKTLPEAKETLLKALHTIVQPAVMVGQIMSKGARTLAPKDTIRHAAQMMDWYGHEGFPVTDPEHGNIVGILSRREVDKARRHKLDGAPIHQFMTKGEFFVNPNDGLETVRNIMVEQRIGQVPVVDPTTNQLLGIVTRTDLISLRRLSEPDENPPPDLSKPLTQRLSTSLLDLLYEASKQATAHDDNLYIVGGFVRDLLIMLNTPLDQTEPALPISPRLDLDLVVEGDAIALGNRLQNDHGGRIYSHRRFGTAKWLLPEPIPFDPHGKGMLGSFDFVTARTEFYRHPSALPEVSRGSIRLDLHRRDFTINTLALQLLPARPTTSGKPALRGELLDFYNGQADLAHGLIRVLHSLSFVEDPTRMLRAGRLMARLGFELESRTRELLTDALDLLPRVSAERIYHELELVFQETSPIEALKQIDRLDILSHIHPALIIDDWLVKSLTRLQQPPPTEFAEVASFSPAESIYYLGLWLFRLPPPVQAEVMERLNLNQKDRTLINQTATIQDQANEISAATQPTTLYHLLAYSSAQARLIAWLGISNKTIRRQLVWYQTELQHVKPIINGDYLKTEFQLKPGPIYRQILHRLRDARLDGQISTLAEEHALVTEMIGLLVDSLRVIRQ
ncbi:CBS domain-containing protein [Anaerolineales bacterium HSG6]|nr:CBS domain-containing protein [Anaerolineales bacterium HSG6]